MELLLFVLASFRLTRLFVDDTITEWLRAPFLSYKEHENEDGIVELHLEIKGSGLRAFIGEILSCHWCMGIWSTGLLLAAWEWVPYTEWLLLLLAISGASAIIRVYLDI